MLKTSTYDPTKYKVVPLEPTENMLMHAIKSGNKLILPVIRMAYAAMVLSAPEPEQPEQGDDDNAAFAWLKSLTFGEAQSARMSASIHSELMTRLSKDTEQLLQVAIKALRKLSGSESFHDEPIYDRQTRINYAGLVLAQITQNSEKHDGK